MDVPRTTTVGFIVAAAVAGLLGTAGVRADTRSYPDPNDTPGLLDIKSVTQGHRGTSLEHRFVTFEPWKLEDLDEAGFGMTINMESNDPDNSNDEYGQFYDYCVGVTLRPRGFRGRLEHCSSTSSRVVGPVEVLHPKPRLVIIRFPDAYLSEPGPYQWGATSSYRGNQGCRKVFCHDYGLNGENVLSLNGHHER